MSKPDKLFELIKTMTMSEKRYFKVFASRHTIGKQNNYIVLFDLIDKKETIDQEQLALDLKKQGISAKYLSSDKNYLYTLILKSLSAFYSGKSTSLQIKEYLHQAEILFDRGLPDHCLRLLKKAHTLAETYHHYDLLDLIEQWELKSLSAQRELDLLDDSLKSQEETLDILENQKEYAKLLVKIRKIKRRVGKVRCMGCERETMQLLNDPMLREESSAKSFSAKLCFWQIKATGGYIIGDNEMDRNSNNEALRLIEEMPRYLEEYPIEYITIRSHLLNQDRTLRDEEFAPRLEAFRAIPDRSQHSSALLKSLVEILSCSAEMSRLIMLERFEEAQDLVPGMERVIKTHGRVMPSGEKTLYYYLFTYTHMRLGDYHTALQYVNKLINELDDQTRPDLHAYGRLLNLVIHFELGNYKVLRYFTDQTLRYMRKTQRIYGTEKELIKLFRKLANHEDAGSQLHLFEKAESTLYDILQDSYEQKILHYFDVLSWLHYRVEKGRTLLAREAS